MSSREWEEIDRLRDWRHAVVTPAIDAAMHRIKQLERQVQELAPMVEAMNTAAHDARIAAATMKRHRSLWATRYGRVLGVAVSLVVAGAEVYRAIVG